MRIPRSRRRAKGRPRRDQRFQVATALVVVVAFFATLNWPGPDARFEALRPAAALATTPTPTPATGGAAFECEVALVNDGDTLRCKDGTKVRLHAVAAREADETCAPGHPCPAATGASATALLNRLAAGKTLTCEPTGRSYERVTAICRTTDGEEINCAMVRSGTTLIWDRFDRQRRSADNDATVRREPRSFDRVPQRGGSDDVIVEILGRAGLDQAAATDSEGIIAQRGETPPRPYRVKFAFSALHLGQLPSQKLSRRRRTSRL